MGMGFRLYLKWGFPVQSHFLTKSPSKRSSSSFRGREASFDSARISFPSVIYEESEILYDDPLKAYAYSSALQILENDYAEIEEAKVNVGKRSCSRLHSMTDDAQMPMPFGGDDSSFLKSVQASKAPHFNLLMENLDILEETFADSNVVSLERDILVHLERLGALQLFHTCLSNTVKTSTSFDMSDAPTELIGEGQMQGTIDDHVSNVVVCSGKKYERKSRRERALEKANKISVLSMPSKTNNKRPGRPTISSAKRPSNSRIKRLIMARNEAEMSRGVKVVADLERIRETLEKETGRVASLSSWADAAGVDKKVLQQRLHFGWYCRDELLRSTHSLIVYLARNYRGMGVAFEDLLQAGNLGVLRGAERFDHTRGYRFSTYAQYWIRKSMSTLVARHARGIHIPFTLSRRIKQIQEAQKACKSVGKYLDDDEIAKFTGLSLAKVQLASKCLRVVGSIDQKMGDCLSVKFMECMPDTSIKSPDEIVMRQHMKKDIYGLLKGLDLREKRVLALRYGFGDHLPKSLEEIGRLLHVSKEWIRKIEKTALAKLKDEETRGNLSHYLNL
ncbi:hypothetical protein L1049_018116 [Liquidambar formosana]|uniref:Sigma factor n=1 Tax=Liquidambar formosana TaxID=63359 RepID=A0AAP0NN70_LIQFO